MRPEAGFLAVGSSRELRRIQKDLTDAGKRLVPPQISYKTNPVGASRLGWIASERAVARAGLQNLREAQALVGLAVGAVRQARQFSEGVKYLEAQKEKAQGEELLELNNEINELNERKARVVQEIKFKGKSLDEYEGRTVDYGRGRVDLHLGDITAAIGAGTVLDVEGAMEDDAKVAAAREALNQALDDAVGRAIDLCIDEKKEGIAAKLENDGRTLLTYVVQDVDEDIAERVCAVAAGEDLAICVVYTEGEENASILNYEKDMELEEGQKIDRIIRGFRLLNEDEDVEGGRAINYVLNWPEGMFGGKEAINTYFLVEGGAAAANLSREMGQVFGVDLSPLNANEEKTEVKFLAVASEEAVEGVRDAAKDWMEYGDMQEALKGLIKNGATDWKATGIGLINIVEDNEDIGGAIAGLFEGVGYGDEERWIKGFDISGAIARTVASSLAAGGTAKNFKDNAELVIENAIESVRDILGEEDTEEVLNSIALDEESVAHEAGKVRTVAQRVYALCREKLDAIALVGDDEPLMKAYDEGKAQVQFMANEATLLPNEIEQEQNWGEIELGVWRTMTELDEAVDGLYRELGRGEEEELWIRENDYDIFEARYNWMQKLVAYFQAMVSFSILLKQNQGQLEQIGKSIMAAYAPVRGGRR